MEDRLRAFLQDKQSFELKNKLDEEISSLLYSFQRALDAMLDSGEHQPNFLRSKIPGKVSKGNNHYGFPYQVLDYSAYLTKEASFSFRTSIWYGNYFSFSLILTGHFIKDTPLDLNKLKGKQYLLTCDENIWETDFTKHKTIDLNQLTQPEFEELLENSNQIKVFTPFSLNQIGALTRLGIESFKSLLIQ